MFGNFGIQCNGFKIVGKIPDGVVVCSVDGVDRNCERIFITNSEPSIAPQIGKIIIMQMIAKNFNPIFMMRALRITNQQSI